MGEKKDDGFLGLNLSLGIGDSEKRRKQNNDLMVMSLASQHMQSSNHQQNSWTDLFLGRISGGARMPVAPGLDMNIAPPSLITEYDEEAGVSSPNSTVSSISAGKKMNDRDPIGEEIEAERASSSRGSDDEDGGDASRKKLRLSKEQSLVLEETFKEQNTLNPKQKLALAKQLNLRPRQVEVWFQNRRARTKLKQTEVDCEYLKRCCENLTEENRRLQKEVQELRALKLSPQLYMQMNPPTTLTMCPSCERVAPSRQQAMPSNPWASAMLIHRRDAPASRS